MIRFAPVDAALEGFRLTRERPMAVLAWAGLLVIVNLLSQVWLATTGLGGVVAAWEAAMVSGKPPADAVAMDSSGGGAALLLLAGVAVNAVLYTAVLRMVLTPGDSRFGYLRLGLAELRQFVLSLALFLTVGVVATLIAAFGAAGASAGFLTALLVVGLVAVLIYGAVRLSLAPSMTFSNRRLTVLGAWSVTQGQFWGLFGAYVLALVLATLVSFLSFIIFGAVARSLSMATGGAFDLVAASTSSPSGATLAGLAQPATLVLLIFSAFWTTLAFTIVAAVAPAAFRALSSRAGEAALL